MNHPLDETGRSIDDTRLSDTGALLVAPPPMATSQRDGQLMESALATLVEVAALLVTENERPSSEADESALVATAHRLLALIVAALDCRSGLMVELAENEVQHLMALLGYPAEVAAVIKKVIEGWPLSATFVEADEYAELQKGKGLVHDLAERYPECAVARLLGQAVIIPMLLRTRLVGFIALHYGNDLRNVSPDELMLVEAIGKFVALVMEQQRLRRAQGESEEHERALHEANQLMSEFLGIAGHEMRTPLTTIKGNLQLARRQLALEIQEQSDVPPSISRTVGAVQVLLARAESQIAVLNRLVRDLINVSRERTNAFELRFAVCDLNTLVRETVTNFSDLPSSRTISCEVVPDASLPVLADADRIGEVIQNYLSNAIKYGARDKPILVRVEHVERKRRARVAVRDEGQGIAPEEQKHIWERFYRGKRTPVEYGEHIGLGLGLYICRMIIERHGGRVGVESSVGQGSTFWFILPLLS
jgi:signal transduction histidine kinase